MYALYYYPGNASLFPHMLLREIGAAFELRLVDRSQNAQKSAEYLRLNPHGQIPVLVDGDLVLYETAAVALHLLDNHPESELAPPVGSKERALFYRWMVHFANTLQPEFRTYFYPHERTGDPSAAPGIKAVAEARLTALFDQISEQLGAQPWLLGERFSAVDLYFLMLARWGRNMSRPPRERRNLGSLAERVLARSAVQTAFEFEGLSTPYV